MPRSRRTKVATSAPREVSSSSTLPTSTTITEETDQVMLPKMRGRGRPPKKKAAEEPLKTDEDSTIVEGVEDSVPPKTRGRGRPPKIKAGGEPSQAIEESALIKEAEQEVEQEAMPVPKTNIRARGRPIMKKTGASAGQQSALEALKQRRNAAMQTKKAKEFSSVALPAPKSNALQELLRTSSTSKSSDERIISTPAVKATPAQRERTPMSQWDTEEDLYGLSPGGEASRLRLESRRKSVQDSHSVLKAQGTPAVETSVLALTNFKRRPRQGSIIRMVQQTSELADPEEHVAFDAEDDPLLQGLEDTLDSFEDFNPENESTPLHLGKRKSDVRAGEPRTSSSRKRKHAQDDEEIQVPQSSPPIPSSPPARHQSPSHSSTSASLPEVVESTQKLLEVDIYSETMAPPQSSSEPASPVRSQIHAEKRRKLSAQHGQENKNDGFPSPTQAKKHKSRKKAPSFSTAALQSLLPKPRRKARAAKHTDDYDIPSSDDGNDAALTLQDSDDDELAHPRARRRATKILMRKVSGNRKKAANSVSPASTRKKTPSAKAIGAEPEKVKVKKMYGHAAVEKENDGNVELCSDHDSDDEDGDMRAVDGRKKRAGSVVPKMFKAKELQAAKKKFAEVDDFEMEFESVDLGGGSSSPWR
ncbi:Helicase required for RNAi-mediated heterochromatin assembly 1 [Venturia nashicola]|nr:Helicase required for RNAi-mediated heterochromatin assembly 1 [Venturia nashicola]